LAPSRIDAKALRAEGAFGKVLVPEFGYLGFGVTLGESQEFRVEKVFVHDLGCPIAFSSHSH
jgi:hypothetical protein